MLGRENLYTGVSGDGSGRAAGIAQAYRVFGANSLVRVDPVAHV
jgi:hypothetical protein